MNMMSVTMRSTKRVAGILTLGLLSFATGYLIGVGQPERVASHTAHYYLAHPEEAAAAYKACMAAPPSNDGVSPDCAAVFAPDEAHNVNNERRKFLTGSSGTNPPGK